MVQHPPTLNGTSCWGGVLHPTAAKISDRPPGIQEYLQGRVLNHLWKNINLQLICVGVTEKHALAFPPYDGAIFSLSQVGADLVQVCGGCFVLAVLGRAFT